MTRPEFADELEALAALVVALPGVSRRNPHAFAEAKQELAHRMRRRAVELRAPGARGQSGSSASLPPIVPGVRTIKGRRVVVERRRSL